MSPTRFGPLDPFGPRLGQRWPADAPRWQQVDGTLGFFDISGYTRLTERLARLGAAGAESIADITDMIFDGLITAAFTFGGDVLQFSGDAILVHFGGEGHESRAARAADAMQQFIRHSGCIDTELGRVRLRMSVGIHSGPTIFALLGTQQHAILALGDGVAKTLAAEKAANPGEILLSAATAATLDPRWWQPGRDGFARLRRVPAENLPPLDEVELRPTVTEQVARAFVPDPVRSLLLEGRLPGEHRQLSLAFVGVKRLDRVLDARGPDRAVAALVALTDVLERAQHDYELVWSGTDALPDAADFILVAGTPVAHEDDEDRILLACREILDADLELEIAIGVNRGRNFTGDVGHPWRRTYSISGDATNLAARIMAHAQPGQLLVHEPLMRGLRGLATTTPQVPFHAKGKRLPVATLQLDGLVARPDDRANPSKTVGRDRELAQMQSSLDRNGAGHGGCVEIVGPAGLGKSHLLHELRRRAVGHQWVQVGGEPYAKTRAFHPVQRLIRTLIGCDDNSDPETVTQRLDLTMRACRPEILPWLPLVAMAAGGTPTTTPETERLHPDFVSDQRTAAVADFVAGVSRDPLVLAFEDLHWFDAASLAVVARLAREASDTTLLVIATRRPDDGAALESVEDRVIIELDALSDAASEAMLIDAAGTTALSEHRLRELAHRASGNPLFLRELAATAADGAELPETVERVLAARIDRLHHRDRIRLREASVSGNPVNLDVLAAALNDPELADPTTWRGVQTIAAIVDGQLHFHHDLARIAAYEGLAHARRRAVHAALARTIAAHTVADTRTADPAALLALHWSEAGVWTEAWTWGCAAVRQAITGDALTDAYTLTRRALDAARRLPELDPVEIATMHETSGDLANRIGLLEGSHIAYARARALHRASALASARLARKRGDVAEKQGQYSNSLRWYRRGMRELTGAPHGPARDALETELQLGYAATLHCQDRNVASRAMTLDLLPAATAAGQELLAQAYLQLATTTALLDRPDGEPYASQAAEVITARGDDLRLACLHLNLGVAAVETNNFPAALDHYARAEAAFARCGDAVGAALALHNRGELLGNLGDPAALECFTDALRQFRASDYRAGELLATSGLGRAAAFDFELERARSLLTLARDGFVALRHPAFAIDADLRLVEVALLAGDVDSADHALRTLAPALDGLERRAQFPLWHDRLRAGVLAHRGRPDQADALLASVVSRSLDAGLEIEAAAALDARTRIPGRTSVAMAAARDEIVARLGIVRLLRL